MLSKCNHIIQKLRTINKPCVQPIRLWPVTPQSWAYDPNVTDFENVQRDPSLSYFRGQPTNFHGSILFLLEPITIFVVRPIVTEDLTAVIVIFRLPNFQSLQPP